jgi:predicted small secreted protein
MTDYLRLFRLAVLGAVLAGALAACEGTIRGVGEDVEDTGEAVEDAVE